MATAPPTINALPAPPDPNDRSTFNTRAYPWSVAQQTLATEVGAVAANVYANAQDAEASANSAADSVLDAIAQVTLANDAAISAAATAGATQWVSGTTYAVGDCVWSPLNKQTYRRRVVGAGTTDPSADTINWTQVGGGISPLYRSARTSNTALTTTDKGKLIDITSGTFSQTFDAVATLGDGWWCYLRNSGTGDITLDPDAAEQIDGLASYVMYPGEVRLVQCDGTALRSVVLNAFYKTFTASGTFTKPPGYSAFGSLQWGAGASGRQGAISSERIGGGGGGCAYVLFASDRLAATETFAIGAGGVGQATNSADGLSGGNSTFAGVTAYGGVGGRQVPASSAGGAAFFNETATQRATTGGATGTSGRPYFGGGNGYIGTVYGGAGGMSISSTNALLPAGSISINGGAGGSTNAAGTDPQPGSAPGGGGGASTDGTTSGAGARGELRIWGVI